MKAGEGSKGRDAQRTQDDTAVTGWRERRAILSDFKSEIINHPRLSIGFGLFWTWVWLVFQTTFFSPSFLVESELLLPGWIVPLAAYAVTFLVLGGLLKFKGIVPKGKAYLRSIPAAMSLGVLVCGVLSFSPLKEPLVNTVVVCFGALLMGAGTSCFHMEWGRVLGALGSRKTILHGIVGTVLAAVFLVLITSFSATFLWIIAFFIPILGMRFLVDESKSMPGLYPKIEDVRLNVPRRFLATSFTQGLSFGIVQTILLTGDYEVPVELLAGSSFAISAMALFVCALFFRMDFNQLIYQIGFLVMALGYLLMSVVAPDFIGALLVHLTGYRFVDIMMWALCVYLIKQRGLPTNWVFAITTCFLLLGQLVGSLVGSAAIALFSLGGQGAHLLSVVMVFVILSLALVLSDRKNLRTGWGMVRPGDAEEPAGDFEMGCELVSRQYGLTAREGEVLLLLAKGRNRAYICTALTLSRETVKTHIRNIYRKMGIHSQEEVFAAVEAEQKSYGFDGDAPQEMRI